MALLSRPRPFLSLSSLPYRPAPTTITSSHPRSRPQRILPPHQQHQTPQYSTSTFTIHSQLLSRHPSPLRQPTTPYIQTRAASTAKRHRKLLRLAPAEFANGPSEITGGSGKSRTALKLHAALQATNTAAAGGTGGGGAVGAQRGGDHVIFTPAPSAPNAYHTPPIFLPRGDVRRSLFEAQDAAAQRGGASASSTTTHPLPTTPRWPASTPLPPPVRRPYTKQYHLTPADMAEMRRLRAEDDTKWTRTTLAARFQCSQMFVGMVAQAGEERLASERRRIRASKELWGPRRRKAREDRVRRREAWGVEA